MATHYVIVAVAAAAAKREVGKQRVMRNGHSNLPQISISVRAVHYLYCGPYTLQKNFEFVRCFYRARSKLASVFDYIGLKTAGRE